MSFLRSLPFLRDYLQNNKNPIKSITDFTKSFTSSNQAKPEKTNTNDITMVSLTSNAQDSYLSSAPEEKPAASPSFKEQKLLPPKEFKLFSSTLQKSHSKVVYFLSNGTMLPSVEGKQRYQEQQNKSKKRCRNYEVESFQQERNRLHKKYINNSWISRQQEDKYDQINSEIARHTMKYFPQEEQQIQTVTRVFFKVKPQINSKNRKRNQLLPTDLPDMADYQINYSMDELEMMGYNEITSVSHLIVQNIYGNIEFLQPVSLYRKDLEDCLKITQKQVKVIDHEWKNKRIRLTINNRVLSNPNNLQRIRECAQSLGLKKQTYDEYSGSLIFTYGNHY